MITLVATLCLAAATIVPQSPVVAADRVDLIEVNHYYDEYGKHVFDQLIFYDWCGDECRFHVRAWRLLKRDDQRPVHDWRRGEFVATWIDDGLLRTVRAAMIRETWTQYDPELLERAVLPKSQRRELRRVRQQEGSGGE